MGEGVDAGEGGAGVVEGLRLVREEGVSAGESDGLSRDAHRADLSSG